MAIKVGESVSRVRNVLKAVKEDPFLTDRFIYSLVMKYAKTLIKRDAKMENIYKNESLFKEIPCVELIDVDKVEACCIAIKTKCTFKRSKEKLPKIQDVNGGPIIRSVTTLDYSQRAKRTLPDLYSNMTRTSGFKYNQKKYYWLMNDYLFIPNVDWEGVRLQAMFDEDINSSLCYLGDDANDCTAEQDRTLSIPEHLFSEIEQMVLSEILTAGKIPSDGADDSQNVLR
jgi:hypothetical protein